jgi:hypothetical protein
MRQAGRLADFRHSYPVDAFFAKQTARCLNQRGTIFFRFFFGDFHDDDPFAKMP